MALRMPAEWTLIDSGAKRPSYKFTSLQHRLEAFRKKCSGCVRDRDFATNCSSSTPVRRKARSLQCSSRLQRSRQGALGCPKGVQCCSQICRGTYAPLSFLCSALTSLCSNQLPNFSCTSSRYVMDD